mgnify:CR=1 FL=1
MSREKEIFERFAIEIAQEIIKKEENPDYEIILDRKSVIGKLSSIMGQEYPETASQFDKRINDHLKRLRRNL